MYVNIYIFLKQIQLGNCYCTFFMRLHNVMCHGLICLPMEKLIKHWLMQSSLLLTYLYLMTLSLSTLGCTQHHVQYCSISLFLRSQDCLISQLATTVCVPVEVKCYIWLSRNEESWHKPVLYELLLIYFIYSHQICQVIIGQVESQLLLDFGELAD